MDDIEKLKQGIEVELARTVSLVNRDPVRALASLDIARLLMSDLFIAVWQLQLPGRKGGT